jgi:hypothetical protein
MLKNSYFIASFVCYLKTELIYLFIVSIFNTHVLSLDIYLLLMPIITSPFFIFLMFSLIDLNLCRVSVCVLHSDSKTYHERYILRYSDTA